MGISPLDDLVREHQRLTQPLAFLASKEQPRASSGHRCAVCGFDLRLGSVSIALDAAHIRWHQAAGPDQKNNGLALCVLHHKVFDLGAFTLNGEGGLLVSDRVNGTVEFHERRSCVITANVSCRHSGPSGTRTQATLIGTAEECSKGRLSMLRSMCRMSQV